MKNQTQTDEAADNRTELVSVVQPLFEEALAFAVVTRVGKVFFGYGINSLLNTDAEDSALIINTIALLLKKRTV